MHGMRDCPRSTVSTDWRDNLKALARQDFKVSISIDVERDYRLDGRITTRGVDEGLPVYFDLLRSHRIPCDLFVSGEVASEVASLGLSLNQSLVALGCHGFNHPAGPASYLSRKSDHVLKRELETATSIIRSRLDRMPSHFRAPNFSISPRALSVLDALGYECDSSILPDRYVRRWGILPILDHRGAPIDPYQPDPGCPTRAGSSRLLEVPLSPNPREPGSPLGLGSLNELGLSIIPTIAQSRSRYLIFLCHTWEMVDWSMGDPVSPWVRAGSKSRPELLEAAIAELDGSRFANMDQIVEDERKRENPYGGET